MVGEKAQGEVRAAVLIGVEVRVKCLPFEFFHPKHALIELSLCTVLKYREILMLHDPKTF